MQKLYADDWTLSPTVFEYKLDWRPSDFVKGELVESHEFTAPGTFIVHLHQGITWQNIPPVNGREFTADDVVYHFQRNYGAGSGMTPSPLAIAAWKDLISVTATDKYTVVFKWNKANQEYILENMQAIGSDRGLEAREAVEKWGDVNDWTRAIGTGPFILKDLIKGSSATLVKNPNYWGYDERYPKNKLPYIDQITVLIIMDDATAMSAMRTGKIDNLDGLTNPQAQSLQKTNPELLQVTTPSASGESLDPRNDRTPFNDIRVREAMQMALNLPEIAETYYFGLVKPTPCTLTSSYLKGWGFPYEDWPQALKDEYAYNPTAAKKLLADAGYATGFKTNILVQGGGDMDLMQIAKSAFAAINIDMEIRTMEATAWIAYCKSSKSYDQMVNRKGGAMVGLGYEPFVQITKFTTSSDSNYAIVRDPVMDSLPGLAAAATTTAEVKQLLKQANELAVRQHYTIALLQAVDFIVYQPWLKGYYGQSRSISGKSTAFFLGFYGARFWIDQNLKRSMGR